MKTKFTKKPFDFEYMKANPETKLVTRDGVEVTEWHYFESMKVIYPLVCVVGRSVFTYTKKGFLKISEDESIHDLFMLVPVAEKVFYANVYEYTFGGTFESLNKAKDNASDSATHIVKVTTSEGNMPTFEIVHRY